MFNNNSVVCPCKCLQTWSKCFFRNICSFIASEFLHSCVVSLSLSLSALIILFWSTAGLCNRSINPCPRITHGNNRVDRKPSPFFPWRLYLNPHLHWLFNLLFWSSRERGKAACPGWYVLRVCGGAHAPMCLSMPEWDGSYRVKIWERRVCVCVRRVQ